MAETTRRNTSAELLDDELVFSMDEFCEACSGTTRWVVELVEEGIIRPVDDADKNWRFTGTSLTRALVAVRLRRDLDVNTPGIALALDLIEEVRELRQRLARLETFERNR
jgi:chaperone modulatory protein CbpM